MPYNPLAHALKLTDQLLAAIADEMEVSPAEARELLERQGYIFSSAFKGGPVFAFQPCSKTDVPGVVQ